jgi:predicted O-methyltransferase YrrM
MREIYDRIERILPSLPGWCTPEKGRRMAELISEARAKLSVEIGVFGARSLVAMALGAEECGGLVVGIDPFERVASLEGTHDQVNNDWWGGLNYEDIFQRANRALVENGLHHHTSIVRAKSLEVVDRYADGSVDCLHHDGNHSEEITSREVEAWAPKMRLGALWIMDDVDWSRHGEDGKLIRTTLLAQKMLEERGFVMTEDHGQWRVYLRGVRS